MGKQLRIMSGIAFLFLLLNGQAIAQDRMLKGKVTNAEDNTTLPGVSVVIKGTTRGTTTDGDGNFSINVPSNATLIFSYIGFEKQEVKVGNQTTLTVLLKSDENALGEVVVTALGVKQEKRALGYSVTEVKGQELADTQRENFLVALQGRVPGLQMSTTSGLAGSSVSITLRGVNSIGGNNSPLFVVDGLPVSNNTFSQGALVSDQANRNNDYMNRIADINPNDIESITVLKGPEAAALYGIDAAGGAIIVTTKKGKAGTRNNISYQNVFRVDEVYRYPEIQQVYGRGTAGVTSPTALSFYGPKYPENTPLVNNAKNFFQKGFMSRHSLSFDGGSPNLTYRASASYTDQTGTVPTNEFKSLNVSLNLTSKVSKILEISPSLTYTNTSTSTPSSGANGYLINALLWPSNDDASNYLNPDGTRRRIISEVAGELDNPFFNLYKNRFTDRTNRIIGRMSFVLTPATWYNLTARVGTDWANTNGLLFTHPEVNLGVARRGAVENYLENNRVLTANVLNTFKKKWGEHWETSLMVAGEMTESRYEVNSSYGERLYINDFQSINNTDPITRNTKLTLRQKRLMSAFGNFNINYRSMLYLTLTGRNDWTSTMPVQNRSFFYPSISSSFVFTELPFLEKNRKVLTYGKIRAAYAEVGRDAQPYLIRSSLTTQTTTGGGFGYGFFGDNPNLVPEFGKSTEIGAEFQFFNGRLGLDVSYYNSRRLNQIVSQRLSYATGFVFGLLNGGSFSTKGVEVSLTGKPLKSKNVGWDVTVNFTKLKTAVLTLPATNIPEYYNSDTWLYGNVRASAFVNNVRDFFPELNLPSELRGAGSALAIGGYDYLRNKNGDILINPNSGLPIVNQNFLPIGDRTPDYTLGINNTIRYKALTLSFLLDIRKGGDVFNGNEMFLFRAGLSPRTLNRETPIQFKGVLRDGLENSDSPTANTIQVTPAFRNDYYSSFAESDYIERNINWLRLRDITLAYALPKETVKSLRFLQSASVFVTGTDLFMVTNYSGADPNVNGTTAASTGSGAAGFDFGKVAVPRGISFGLRVGF